MLSDPPKINMMRYAMWFTGSLLVLMTIGMVILRLTGTALTSLAFLPVLPALVASMVEGSNWAKVTKDPVPVPWKTAFSMTGVGIGITAMLVFLTLATSAGLTFGAIRIVVILGAVYAFFWFFTNRIFLTMGARNEWASQDRGDA